ncbi:hypothetical protein MSIMFI_03794 [Mycobacterium simulans]|uniref:helix-turn-helix domain-containing protein n=1 Tax=Mycobacterium simulans TaxID=627089 RepID=UPI00174A943D|nr:helix-turn-helix domain-containing protein [Mycobacterium simulans]SON62269.1 hypothetical protein MSIMFI_03794 [Mycobacterium simulans]
MISVKHGVVLDPAELSFIAGVLDELCRRISAEPGRRPAPKLEQFAAQLRKCSAGATNATNGVTNVGVRQDSGHAGPYDLDLLDSAEAGRILGISAAGVRAAARRGRLPAHRPGGRWLFPAAAVVARAERNAARKAS